MSLMKKVWVIILAASIAGCSWTSSPKPQEQSKQNFFQPTPNIAQREVAKREGGSILDSKKKIAEIKAMFAERNAYNRDPVAPRLEGKSQGAGDCNAITMQASKIPLNVFLSAVAGDRTVRVHNDNGAISMNTEINVSADNECDEELIDRVLTNLDIAYTINNDVLNIMPTVSKTYQLPLLKPMQKYSSASQTNAINGAAGGGSTSGGGTSGGAAGASGGKVSFKDEGVDAFAELKENLEDVLNAKEKGSLNKVMINRMQGTVTVVAPPSGQRKTEKIIASYTEDLSKTVMVTASIIEVNKSDLDERGLSMDMLFNGAKGALSVITDFGSQVQGSSGKIRLFNNGSSVVGDVQGVLRAQGIRFQQRTAPSASVDNRTGATLKVGGSEQYVESISLTSSSTGSGGASQTLPAPQLGILQTGVQMEVWPFIMDDKIVAQLHLSIVDKKGDKSFTFTNVGTFNSPILSNSEVNTKITMKSGQTAVIQGLTTETNNDATDGFPILSKLPVIGALFGHTKKETIKNEAVVFLTLTEVKN